MAAVDPLQEVSDLKRKLRLIKNKLLDPTERNLRQAINMIDDTFATEEVHMNCSRFGITCAPPPMFAVPVYPIHSPHTPMDMKSPPMPPAPIMTAAQTQTDEPKLRTISTQTNETGDSCSFRKSELYSTTQMNIDKALELLTETKNSLAERGKKRKHDGSSTRSKALPPMSTALCSTTQFSRTLTTPTGRPVTHLQRVQKQSESKPGTSNMLMSTEKLAIEDSVKGKYTPTRDKNCDPVSASKKQKIKEVSFPCKYCYFRGDSHDSLFYHDCNLLPHLESPFFCCGTFYKHRGYYTRHRDLKHKMESHGK